MSASSKKKLRKEQEAVLLTEKQRQEKKEAKKLKTYTIIFVVIMALVLGVFAYSLVSRALNNSGIPQRLSTALEVNDHEISAAELGYFYSDAISEQYNNWYTEFGQSTSAVVQYYYGLNLSAPLDQQYYDEDKIMTWGEYFGNVALRNATQVYALADAAKAAGYTLTDADKASIENNMVNVSNYATTGGYSSVEDYLKVMYGNGATEESFRAYSELSALAQSYYDNHVTTLKYEDADYREYEKEHYDEFSNFDYLTFPMSVTDFTEGTKNEDGTITYTDEQKAAGLKAAQEAAAAVEASKASTEEELNAAIKAISVYKDNESAKAFLNENIVYSNVNSTLRDWISAHERKAGDLGVIPITSTTTDENGTETTQTTGYYLVIYQGREDNNMNLVNVRHILVAFEGGTKDAATGQTTYSDEEKAAAKKEAEELLAKFEAGKKTELDFEALVKENSDDPGSNENGGLYEEVYPGQMVTSFNDWCFDESRKAGDYGLVETEYGYHLMFFVSKSDTIYRDFLIENTLRVQDMNTWMEGLVDAATVGKQDISKLDLDRIVIPYSNY